MGCRSLGLDIGMAQDALNSTLKLQLPVVSMVGGIIMESVLGMVRGGHHQGWFGSHAQSLVLETMLMIQSSFNLASLAHSESNLLTYPLTNSNVDDDGSKLFQSPVHNQGG